MASYRIDRSYLWNYERGPQLRGAMPRVPSTPLKDFFGFQVGSRVGVAAGLLLNSKWIGAYARLGFDVLTYKTLRSSARPCYPLPNWLFVAPDGDFDVARDQILRPVRRPRDPAQTTAAVCFGMPSMAPEVWRRDLGVAKRSLARGQVLIVSVVGTPEPGAGEAGLIEDFVRCARWAAEAGADIIEANYSCPNVCTPEGSVYQDAGTSARLSEALRAALPSTPLFIKAGHFSDESATRAFFRAVGRYADAVVLVNGIARRVLHRDGRPAFGDFERVGILGRAIHRGAVDCAAGAIRAARDAGVATRVIGVGGVMDAGDAGDFFAIGAAGAVMGGAPMLDPELAVRIKRAHPEW